MWNLEKSKEVKRVVLHNLEHIFMRRETCGRLDLPVYSEPKIIHVVHIFFSRIEFSSLEEKLLQKDDFFEAICTL